MHTVFCVMNIMYDIKYKISTNKSNSTCSKGFLINFLFR